MLGVPNERYDSWVVRLDLTKLATHGAEADTQKIDTEEASAIPTVQEDSVQVTVRHKKSGRTGTDG